ncbi:DNA polymerase III subunit beta [bacterium]|nr:DNA polymerase III subunit beta [bacterium]
MKVIFERQSLASGISLIQNIVNSASTMPILANILIEAGAESTTIYGTDLESFGRVEMKAQVEEGGRVTVNARLLADIVKLMPEGEVVMDATGNKLTISGGRNTYAMGTMPSDDFPEWPRIEAETTLVLRQADLRRILHNTMFAIPVRDPRKVLMGVLFELNGGRLTCVATDGRKLGKITIEPTEIRGRDSISVILPKRILEELDKAIGEEGEIELGISDRQVSFTLDNLSYVSARLEGTYPKYDAVIPQSFKRTIRIQKTTLADAINRAAIVAERRHHSILLKFSTGQIEIQAQSSEDGTYEGAIETDYQGESFKLAFNHQYLQEIFKVTPDPQVDLKIKDVNAPIVFECESDPQSLFLVMPVRISEIEEAEANV